MIAAVEPTRIDGKPSVKYQPLDKRGVMLDLGLETEVPVVPRQRVEAVGTGGDDPGNSVPLHDVDVGGRLCLIKVLVAELSGWLPATGLSLPGIPNLMPAAERGGVAGSADRRLAVDA